MKKTIRFDYTGDVQILNLPRYTKSIYIEAYGSAGGVVSSSYVGKGGKASGTYKFKDTNEKILYIYVGSRNGWNGGGANTYPGAGCGGGASDVRLVKASHDSWYDTAHTSWINDESLKSRIIVAGGGGGMRGDDPYWGYAGYGGGLIGQSGLSRYYTNATGGTQVSGGIGTANDGGFGYGGTGNNGGGGGWYGGGGTSTRLAGAGGGSSYIELLEDDGETQGGVNSGNGYVIITYEEDISYFIKQNNNYYIPTKEYFNVKAVSFNPVTIDDIFEKYQNLDYLSIYELNNKFTLEDGTEIIPSNIINFNEYEICCITPQNLNKIKAVYTPSKVNISKSDISVKEKLVDISYKNYLDIESSDKTLLDYRMSNNNEYKNCSILDIEILKNFSYVTFRFNSPDSNLSKIFLNEYNGLKLNKINKSNFNCEMDLLNLHITFNNDYNKVLINTLNKQKIKYSTDTLDKF